MADLREHHFLLCLQWPLVQYCISVFQIANTSVHGMNQSKPKHATGARRGKSGNWCQAQDDMPLMPSAGRHATAAKRGKTCNWCQAREDMQLMPSAGRRATDAKRGKTCNWCQAREDLQLMPSAGRHATDAKRGKTCNWCQAREVISRCQAREDMRKPSDDLFWFWFWLVEKAASLFWLVNERCASSLKLEQKRIKANTCLLTKGPLETMNNNPDCDTFTSRLFAGSFSW